MKVCTACEKAKAEDAFEKYASGRLRSWCRACRNRANSARYQTEHYKQWRHAYDAKPEVKEKKAARDRKRAVVRATARRLSEKTVRGRILHCRRHARAKLKASETAKRRRHYEGLIASYTKELARLERQVA